MSSRPPHSISIRALGKEFARRNGLIFSPSGERGCSLRTANSDKDISCAHSKYHDNRLFPRHSSGVRVVRSPIRDIEIKRVNQEKVIKRVNHREGMRRVRMFGVIEYNSRRSNSANLHRHRAQLHCCARHHRPNLWNAAPQQ